MKKTLLAIAVLLLASGAMLGQEKEKSYDEFSGHWLITVQGGIGQTVGETRFGDLISPAAALSFGYQFTPVWGLRAGVSGWQAKGAVVDATTTVYKYNYLQGSVDVMVDLCGIAGYRVSRAVSPYIFAGIGVNGAFNNDEAQELGPRLPEDNLLWDGSKILPAGRFGVGMGVRLTDAVHFNIEVNANILGDSFNSKRGSAVDWQLGALAGFTFKIGRLKKDRPVEEVPVVAEPEPVQEVEAVPFTPVESSVYFRIGRSEIRESEMAKVEEIVAVLKANPGTRVTVTGHADAETGTESRNMELSKERAENVAEAIVAAGIEAGRVTVAYKGDKESVSDVPEENRVAVCVVADGK